ncbi:T7SS effector LXG polymorphic toxin [Parageobacillus thermoglucosidasius]|uniref:T7SS effector LXG polymorphic toxin n=1 Tax=Parageobacillus thermoglucosidasius TaxID=1426 RepID=UPI002E215FD8|nr:T7SS effector LXG polymorphic toxin [Parageobacillus thermoglucosidasius]MED4914024.1 T7SS effector LXG polymorphic toxin [Parageobacillus thermoglucosidasius]MED4945741.1 T7SS effector LXG polymorphic toxin [Parageobacillus thermoglucosidasius]MED4981330.1 T7SS effector LXG polymorphic toxin [Parageobacillus thermoglucosidasius]
MKILHVRDLYHAIDGTMQSIDEKRRQLQQIRQSIRQFISLGHAFTGEGGDAIRNYYADCHIPFLTYLEQFLADFQHTLTQIKQAAASLESHEHGVIREDFLQQEVQVGLQRIYEVTRTLVSEANKEIASVQDIVSLPYLDEQGVIEGVRQAERNKNETLEQLYEFDRSQAAALEQLRPRIEAMNNYIAEMQAMFKHRNISIASYNIKAIQEKEAYKKIVESEEINHPKNEEELFEDILKGVGVGIFDTGKDFVAGLYDFVTNPVRTIEGFIHAVIHPVDTVKYISKAIQDSFERDMVNGDAYSRAHWVTYALGIIATSIAGTKGAGSITKTGLSTTKTVVQHSVEKAAAAIDPSSIAKFLPYAPPQLQLALSGGVPYNVVNSVGLKDQLITLAKVEAGDKGTVKASKNNYRKKYLQEYPGLPEGWQVHHSLPQKYEKIMKEVGINIHEVKYLRGVDPKIHSKITTEWARWEKRLGRTPTAKEIIDFAKQMDIKYGKYWYKK